MPLPHPIHFLDIPGFCALILFGLFSRFPQTRFLSFMVTILAPAVHAHSFALSSGFYCACVSRRIPPAPPPTTPCSILASTVHTPSKGISPFMFIPAPTSHPPVIHVNGLNFFPGEMEKLVFPACMGINVLLVENMAVP